MSAETFETLLTRPGVRIERIVSNGDVTPPDTPHLQAHDEWVMIVSGSARLTIEGIGQIGLRPGDHVLIPGGTKHWVTHTSLTEPTVWIAAHFDAGRP